MKNISFIVLAIIIFSACYNKPENIIPRQTYKQVLKEIILANLVQQKFTRKDSSVKDLKLLVYKKYKVDSILLKKTTDYYSRHPEELAEIYDEIYIEFKHKADSLDKIMPHKKTQKTDKIKIKKELLHSKKLQKNQ